VSRTLQRLIDRLERLGYLGDWSLRLGRALGTPSSVRVVRHTVPSQRYPAEAPPLRIGFAADFHAGPMTDPLVLTAACRALAAGQPDLILLGGDFVSLEARDIDQLVPELKALQAPLGCYAVLGNHDYWASAGHIEARLRDAGFGLLTNRNIRLPPPFDSVWLCGLDDHWQGRPDPGAAFERADGIRIVLMHSPSGLLDLEAYPFDLALCGHTHGGQIAFPSGRPVLLPHGPLSRRYARGRFMVRGGTLIVTIGVGCSVLPVRVFAPPEVVICEVKAAQNPR
jgi:predicted MPP superfamily phosphohydrolase